MATIVYPVEHDILPLNIGGVIMRTLTRPRYRLAADPRDTLESIAQQMGTTLQVLREQNPSLTDRDPTTELPIGMQLKYVPPYVSGSCPIPRVDSTSPS